MILTDNEIAAEVMTEFNEIAKSLEEHPHVSEYGYSIELDSDEYESCVNFGISVKQLTNEDGDYFYDADLEAAVSEQKGRTIYRIGNWQTTDHVQFNRRFSEETFRFFNRIDEYDFEKAGREAYFEDRLTGMQEAPSAKQILQEWY